jgi:Xaa-Pro aminopeptidase
MIPKRLAALRSEMKERGIAVYMVPTADFHESEYVGAYFKSREFLTGFTGSAGTAVVTQTEAGLWTDGRYFVQAGKQLAGSGIRLYRMGEEGVPTVNEYIEDVLPEGAGLGFDGRCISTEQGQKLEEIVGGKGGSILCDEDLVGLIWRERPQMAAESAWVLDTKYSGLDVSDKLKQVRAKMQEQRATLHLLTDLCDIAWLLNVRGSDICHVPVVLSYLVVTTEACIWFVQEAALDDKMRAYLDENRIEIRPYTQFYEYVGQISNETVLWDAGSVNYRISRSLPKTNQIIDCANPTALMRAVKNETELSHIRSAHKKDAVAMCRFMYWLKTQIGKIPMTELSVSEKLREFRADGDDFLDESFDTICAYAEHGAIVHYSATEETDVALRPEGLLLVDSGGHYLDGTTDITRTFALGAVTDAMRADYTRVCRANLNLSNAHFLHGCTGRNLDILARAPLWEAGLDYRHGTGHGVGYLLNVHEGPNAFRWKSAGNPLNDVVLEEGMVTTDEPGIYLEGRYGIRLENELVCRRAKKNEYGQFLCFENLTYVPFDLDVIDPEQMTIEERKRLNDYHAAVYREISPFLEGEELAWLKEATRSV